MALVPSIVALLGQFRRPKDPKKLGRFAEDLSAWYFRLKGYEILARNWRTRSGEIDLVVKKGTNIVFVEVKARRTKTRGRPEEALTPQKKRRLYRLAEAYLAAQPTEAETFRFDLVAVDFSEKLPQLKHYQGVIEDEGS
ncbi:MAG: YraN family protein [Thermodesulfobacteria bacterium]|nr:YraN family protein [Thermodesulfobacteriota bacterium]